jgi:catechol 2,3-dioxygenase-like lactoylglutathione lyase family enzyme
MAHLTNIDQIDIVVENPQRMAEFLTSIGFTFRRKTDGARGSYEVAFPGLGDQPILELTPSTTADGAARSVGLRHIAVRSTNIHETYEELTARGYHFDQPPRPIPETSRLLTNLMDPEGRFLQIVDSVKSVDSA